MNLAKAAYPIAIVTQDLRSMRSELLAGNPSCRWPAHETNPRSLTNAKTRRNPLTKRQRFSFFARRRAHRAWKWRGSWYGGSSPVNCRLFHFVGGNSQDLALFGEAQQVDSPVGVGQGQVSAFG